MHAADDSTPPPRSGLKRLIRPWEYRHLHAMMAVRFGCGGFQLALGLVLVSFGRQADTGTERRKMYRLAGWFLVPAVLNLLGGLLDLSAARPLPGCRPPAAD
jgi:low temperature requirement protein LtrA